MEYFFIKELSQKSEKEIKKLEKKIKELEERIKELESWVDYQINYKLEQMEQK